MSLEVVGGVLGERGEGTIQLVCGLSISTERASTSSVSRRQCEDELASMLYLSTQSYAGHWAQHAVVDDVVLAIGRGMWSEMCLIETPGRCVENHAANHLFT